MRNSHGNIRSRPTIFHVFDGVVYDRPSVDPNVYLRGTAGYRYPLQAIINIILRASGDGYGKGQCLPYWSYDNNGFFNQFNGNNFGNVAGNNGVSGISGFDNNNNNNNNNNGNYRSIWCGDRYMVYVVNAIIIALAIPALVAALSLLLKRRNVNTATTTSQSKTTRTFATA